MNAPFDAQTTMGSFLYSVLSSDSAVLAAIGGANRIHPYTAPPTVDTRHLAYEDYGGVAVAKPVGAPVALVTMNWAVTGWEPAPTQTTLRALMKAVMATLLKSDTRGRNHRFLDDGKTWDIMVDYLQPDKVDPEQFPGPVWAPVRVIYRLSLQQVS